MGDILSNIVVTVIGCIATYVFTIAQVRQELRRGEIGELISEVNSIHNSVIFIMAQGAVQTNEERMREARSIISRLSDVSGRISHLRLAEKKKRDIEIHFVAFKKSATGVGTNFESVDYTPIPITEKYFIQMEVHKQKLNEALRIARNVNLIGR